MANSTFKTGCHTFTLYVHRTALYLHTKIYIFQKETQIIYLVQDFLNPDI